MKRGKEKKRTEKKRTEKKRKHRSSKRVNDKEQARYKSQRQLGCGMREELEH